MLKLKPSCERCEKPLPPDASDAMICSFECTFCRECVEGQLKLECLNCGGNLQPRPIRPASSLAQYPAQSKPWVSGMVGLLGWIKPIARV